MNDARLPMKSAQPIISMTLTCVTFCESKSSSVGQTFSLSTCCYGSHTFPRTASARREHPTQRLKIVSCNPGALRGDALAMAPLAAGPFHIVYLDPSN